MKSALLFLVLQACATAAVGVVSVLHRDTSDAYDKKPLFVADSHATVTNLTALPDLSTLRSRAGPPSYMFFVYIGLVVAITLCVGGLAVAVGRSQATGDEAESAEASPQQQQQGAAAPPSSAAEVDIEKLMKLLVKRGAQQVGPKLAKAAKVKNVLEHGIFGIKNRIASFLMDEVFGIVARVLREMEAEEAMLLFDPAAAAAANLPPVSVLLAGLLSPIILSISLVIHLSQVFLVLLPVLCMCVWALYVDRFTLQSCAVPTISFWIYFQGGVSLLLLVSHLMSSVQIQMGKASIRAKIDGMQDRLREALSDGELSLDEVRELFIVGAILLEHSLVVEDRLRRSVWRTIIGYGTIAWMVLTLWTFVLVLGWTFIPGMVAFHPSVAKIAGDDYCGAWATVLTARLSCVLSLFFLLFNLISVVQFVSDKLVTSEVYSAALLSAAKGFDESAGGVPVMQTLIKALLLRGNGDSIKDQIAQSYGQKALLQKQQGELKGTIASLQSRIQSHKSDAKALKQAQGIPEEDDLDAMENSLLKSASGITQDAAAQAKALEQKTKEEFEAMYEKLLEAAKSLQEQAQQAKEAGVQGLSEAATSGLASAQDAAAAGYASAQEAGGAAGSQLTAAQQAAGTHLVAAQGAAGRAAEQAKSMAAAAK